MRKGFYGRYFFQKKGTLFLYFRVKNLTSLTKYIYSKISFFEGSIQVNGYDAYKMKSHFPY